MKKSYLLMVLATILFMLTGCANRTFQYVQARSDLLQEDWSKALGGNPKAWLKMGDRWFFTGYPHSFAEYAPNAPFENATTRAQVRVPNFTRIRVEGPFTVQIFGSSQNSVTILGSNQQVRHARVDIRNNRLYVRALADSEGPINFQNTIVRIGVRELSYLIHAGSGLVEGKHICSRKLVVKSCGTGNLLLEGSLHLSHVVQAGTGTIAMLGVYSPNVDIDVLNNGNLYLSGRVGAHRILKKGFGCLNIIGADSNALTVDATGGLTTIAGAVDLHRINAIDVAQVYIAWINSDKININTYGDARVGLAGFANALNVFAAGNSRFEGKCMHAPEIYARAYENAHANVDASRKLFASTRNLGSIYFFSSPPEVSRFSKDQGLVLPIFSNKCTMCPPAYARSARCGIPMEVHVLCDTPHKKN